MLSTIDAHQAERIPMLLLPPTPLLILIHLSKKRHRMFPVNAAKEDKCQRGMGTSQLP